MRFLIRYLPNGMIFVKDLDQDFFDQEFVQTLEEAMTFIKQQRELRGEDPDRA